MTISRGVGRLDRNEALWTVTAPGVTDWPPGSRNGAPPSFLTRLTRCLTRLGVGFAVPPWPGRVTLPCGCDLGFANWLSMAFWSASAQVVYCSELVCRSCSAVCSTLTL